MEGIAIELEEKIVEAKCRSEEAWEAARKAKDNTQRMDGLTDPDRKVEVTPNL